MSDEIETLGDLMRAVATAKFGGYESFDITITNEHSSYVDSFKGGGFLIITVIPSNNTITSRDHDIITDYVGTSIWGEWWFDANDLVMQVL